MDIEKGPIEGLLILTPRVLRDERGFFLESYNERSFAEAGITHPWRQDNHVASTAGVLRGLHFQRRPGQAKLIRCVRGRIFDVAVDIRPDSPTLGRWFGSELTAESFRMFYVPVGFAHGYAVLSEEAEVFYKCSNVYDAAEEDGFRWDDPEVGVEWPLESPIISERDRNCQSFSQTMARIRSMPEHTSS